MAIALLEPIIFIIDNHMAIEAGPTGSQGKSIEIQISSVMAGLCVRCSLFLYVVEISAMTKILITCMLAIADLLV